MSDVRALLWDGVITQREAASRLLVSDEHIAALITIGALTHGNPIKTYAGQLCTAVEGSVAVVDKDLVMHLVEYTWKRDAVVVLGKQLVPISDYNEREWREHLASLVDQYER